MGGQGGDLIHGKGTDMYCALAVCINLHLTVTMQHSGIFSQAEVSENIGFTTAEQSFSLLGNHVLSSFF